MNYGFNPQLDKELLISNKLYFRMHGTNKIYEGSYDLKILKKIKKFIIDKQKKLNLKDCYIFFNNTDALNKIVPDAIKDALQIKNLLENK